MLIERIRRPPGRQEALNLEIKMSKRNIFLNLTSLIAGGVLIAGCSLRGLGGEASVSPPSNQPAVSASATPSNSGEDFTLATEQSQVEPSKAFVPISRNAEDCAYGGEFKSIQALDEKTVRFELCYPDVAFLSKIAFPSFGILPSEFLEKHRWRGKKQPIVDGTHWERSISGRELETGRRIKFFRIPGLLGRRSGFNPQS